MLVAQRINDFITANAPNPFCNRCIKDELSLKKEAHAAQNTAALGTTSDFVREHGVCSICKNEKK